MYFDEVLKKLRLKHTIGITKDDWHLKGMIVKLQQTDEYSKMTQNYLFIEITNKNGSKYLSPWTPSQSDLLTNGWRCL